MPEGRIAEPLYPGALFSWVLMADGTRRVAVTSERAFTADDGKVRTLQLASWFSIDYSDSSASGPVILRIFLPEGDTFRQVYSSASDKRFHIPRSALEEIGKGASTVFIPEPDWTDDTPGAHSLDRRGARRKRRGPGAVRHLRPPAPLPGLAGEPVLFWGFFIFGTLLLGGDRGTCWPAG